MQEQPDIEIYVKNLNDDMLLPWLEKHFDRIDKDSLKRINLNSAKPVSVSLALDSHDIELFVTPKAAGKAYCSLWFKSGHTPWENDLNCAESFISLVDTEVRCSAETWTEQEAENSDMWWVISATERNLVPWS
jgi:hypothetical protein